MSAAVQIEASWKEILADEFTKPYFESLTSKIRDAVRAGKVIYPPGALIFNAFNTTPFHKVKVVILGQDPYHGPGQAMGLSFSVPRGVSPPPSLKNIYKELQHDLKVPIAQHGDLTSWAEQGVFLLNAMLSVEKGRAGSHKGFGWQSFTNKVIESLSMNREGLVFLLWGKFAQSKLPLIDELRHHVLQSAHPSPFTGSAFFNNHHFSRTNELLLAQGDTPIKWQLPP